MDADAKDVYDFGLRLKKLRQERKLSQDGLAKRLGVSKETVYRYESNVQEPSLKRAKQMAQILGTSLDYLVGLDDVLTVKVSCLTREECEALNEFIRAIEHTRR